MKIGVYVGSFNPVHKGHINVANYLLENDFVDKVLMIPTVEYWNKKNLASIQDRINMLKFYEKDDLIIDTSHNYQYTYQIMRALQKEYDDLYLIIGSDNLINLDKWKNIGEILKNKIIVVNRGKIDKSIIEKLGKLNFIVIENFRDTASSTQVRNGKIKLLDQKIYEYIKHNKLYGEKI